MWRMDSEIIEELRRDPFRRTREEVWICSLSKIHDSILMWSYYVSIKVSASVWTWRKFENTFLHVWRNYDWLFEVEVQYKDIVEKPDYFRDAKDFFHYQLSTKAKGLGA